MDKSYYNITESCSFGRRGMKCIVCNKKIIVEQGITVFFDNYQSTVWNNEEIKGE